jgi:hypothetical protein
MAQQVAGGVREKIVTLESLQPPMTEGLESRGRGVETPEEQLRVERYYQIMERLRQETADTGSKLMITVPDREVSILQSELARQAADARALESGGLEVKFGAGFGGGDWLGWIFSLFNHIDRSQAHPMVRPTTTTPDRIPDNAKIAMTADWSVRRAEDRPADEEDRRLRAADASRRHLLLGD